MKIIKKTILIPALFALASCESRVFVLTDFKFKDDKVQIKDTLNNVENEKAHVVLLYGQSNADGVSHSSYLERNDKTKYDEYLEGYDNVLINYVNDGWLTSSNSSFIKCTLGCGYTSTAFGPEVGIAEIMHNKYKNEKTFIIKWTWGGTVLDNQWLNGKLARGDLYNSSMDFTLKSLNYLKDKGYKIQLDGICWMQGESDCLFVDQNRYLEDTEAYVAFLRHDLKKYNENIRFIDAGINEEEGIWLKPELVNNAKKEFANKDNLNIYIDSAELKLTSMGEPDGQVDFAHFDSMSMVKLGQAFGDALTK